MLYWLRNYRRSLFAGDLVAGVIVALMLIPQGMAYAIVAGLPPVTGLYASLLPPLAYALFGSSNVQSVGPMAITSLMIGAALAPLCAPGSALSVVLAGEMALIVGVVLFVLGLLRLGLLANLLSRPVMSGFTTGAALLIAYDQIDLLLGGSLSLRNVHSAALGLASLAALWLAKQYLAGALKGLGLRAKHADIFSKLAPVLVVATATLVVGLLGLASSGVAVVGDIPAGWPALHLAPSVAHLHALLMPSLLIGFMVFLSSQSAAQSLAQKRNERIVTNYELLGLGAANLASAVSGGFAVTGSISRSAVNYSAGANTPLASIISAALLAAILLMPTAGLSLLPLPTLAATIIIAVIGMVDLETLRDSWRYDKGDAWALITTTLGVLVLGVEQGVILGVVLSLITLLWRSSRPHIAIIGRVPGSEHFRNSERYQVEMLPTALLVRIDANLFFGNATHVIETIEHEVRERHLSGHAVTDVLLAMSAINSIDMTGLFALNELNRSLGQQQIKLHFSEVKGPVLDHLKRSDLISKQLTGQVFLSTADAYAAFQR